MTDASTPAAPGRRPPTKEELTLLPPYERLPADRIHVVRSLSQESFVRDELARSGVAGFDTESKPVFDAAVRNDGPHVVQLSTVDHAFVFQSHRADTLALLRECLESTSLLKVGFGLNSDRGPLLRKFGIDLRNYVDLSHAFRGLGYRQSVGAKAAVAIVLGRRLQKSRSATTSNWALRELSPKQLQYAADDAHSALVVHLAMTRSAAAQPHRTSSRPGGDPGPLRS